MKIVAIIQARCSSTRLPGKSMMLLAGKPLIWHVINRAKQCHKIDQVVVATTDLSTDDLLSDCCLAEGIKCFRGSEEDVLDRYVRASQMFDADIVIRLCGDCAFLDPIAVDTIIYEFCSSKVDLHGLFHKDDEIPYGLECEVVAFKSLLKCSELAIAASDREHVTVYIKNHPDIFKCSRSSYFKSKGLFGERWVID